MGEIENFEQAIEFLFKKLDINHTQLRIIQTLLGIPEISGLKLDRDLTSFFLTRKADELRSTYLYLDGRVAREYYCPDKLKGLLTEYGLEPYLRQGPEKSDLETSSGYSHISVCFDADFPDGIEKRTVWPVKNAVYLYLREQDQEDNLARS